MALLTLPWWPLSPWLSPAAAWFIFFNAVVGTIAVMSSSAQPGQGGGGETSLSRRRLCRSGSSSMVLDRLRSFSIFSVHPAAGGITGPPLVDDGGAVSDSHCYYCCSRQAEEVLPSPLAVAAATAGETETSGRAPPSAPGEMAKAEDHAARAPAPADEGDNKAVAEEVLQDDSIGLDEPYALAQRHRATQPLPSPPPPAAPATAAPTLTSPARRKNMKKPAKVAEGIRRRRAEAGEALEGKAELNARADLFIRQFREDLKLQRLNSILRHTQALGSPTAAR